MNTLIEHITATVEDTTYPIIYLAGKISGLPEAQYRAKFQKAQQELEAKGWRVINPCNLIQDPDTPWEDAMRICIRALTHASAICILPCQRESRGATIERNLSSDLGITRWNGVDNVPDINTQPIRPGLMVLKPGELKPTAIEVVQMHRSKSHK